MILAASSPFFQNLLKRNHHPHPLIFMRNVSFENLSAIIDYLYLGEASLIEENLESFLQIAEELALKGLARENRERGQKQPQIKEELDVENAENVQGFEFEVIDPIANDSDDKNTEVNFKKTRTSPTKPKKKLSDYGRNCRRNTIRTNCIPCGLKFSSERERRHHEETNQDCKSQLEHEDEVNSLMEKSKKFILNGKCRDGTRKKLYLMRLGLLSLLSFYHSYYHGHQVAPKKV